MRLLIGITYEMLTKFDQNTIANMTAALEYVCKRIPSDCDTHALRKHIGDAMIASANGGRRTFIDFQNAGLKALDDVTSPSKANWFRWPFRERK